MRKIFIAAAIVILILILIFLTLPGKKQNAPIKTPAPIQSGSSVNNYYWTKETRDASKKSYAVGELIDKLPHRGTNFTMQYDIDKDEFTVVLNSENLALANKELDAFLVENKIGERSWIPKIVVKREALRP